MSMQQPGTPAPRIPESERISNARKKYNMIWMALLATIAVYGYVAFFLLNRIPPTSFANFAILFYVLSGVAVCDLAFGYVYFFF